MNARTMATFPIYDVRASVVGIVPEITQLAREQKGEPMPKPELGAIITDPIYTFEKCSECGCTGSAGQLAAHLANYRDEHRRHCVICEVTLPTIGARKDHENIYHNSESYAKYRCPKCPYRTWHKGWMDDHYAAGHMPATSGKAKSRKVVTCCLFRCPAEFTGTRLRDAHQKKESHEAFCRAGSEPNMRVTYDRHASLVGVMPEITQMADRQEKQADMLAQCYRHKDTSRPELLHYTHAHCPSWANMENYKKVWHCSECNVVIETETECAAHIAHGIAKHKRTCDICNVTFRYSRQLTEHMAVYHAQSLRLKYACRLCPQQCDSMPCVDNHMSAYHGIDLFVCGYRACSSTWASKLERQTHMYTCRAGNGQ